MPKIMVLPDHVASQIAAGEVVERPASVVKELVENAIDAGATQIEIAIGSQCRDIRIADDGSGMDHEDAILAFQRHATSKLTSADDLSALRTLGFRGEALPSIASVAKVTCYTRTAQAINGTRIDTADGQLDAREVGCAQGTVIEVTDLFYNVPARLSFLKKPTTEFAHIHEIIQSLAVAHPKVMFQLLNHGEVVLRTTGTGKLAQVMQEIGMLTGKEQLVDVTSADLRYGMAIYGYVARPPHSRGDRRGIMVIVNNRPVRCPVAYKALDYAFADLIPKGKHPIGVLTITMDPKELDVNIHPTKKEIKYSNSSDVYMSLQRALQEALRAQREIVETTAAAFKEPVAVGAALSHAAYEHGTGTTYGAEPAHLATVHERLITEPIAANPRSTHQRLQQISFRDKLAYTPPQPAPISTSAITDPSTGAGTRAAQPITLPAGWRLLGYLHNTYFLVQTSEGLRIIEQHIAHERVIYERILSQQTVPGRVSENSQRLVISAPLNLSEEQRSCLLDNMTALQTLGYDFEIQENQIACSQVPLELATKDYASSVQTGLEQLLITDNVNFQLEASKSLACQAAIKNGMPLSESEIIELLSAWYQCQRNDTCPHGRPISLSFSKEKLFEMFHPA